MKTQCAVALLLLSFVSFGVAVYPCFAMETVWEDEVILWDVDGIENITFNSCQEIEPGVVECSYTGDFPSPWQTLLTSAKSTGGDDSLWDHNCLGVNVDNVYTRATCVCPLDFTLEWEFFPSSDLYFIDIELYRQKDTVPSTCFELKIHIELKNNDPTANWRNPWLNGGMYQNKYADFNGDDSQPGDPKRFKWKKPRGGGPGS